MLILFLTSKSIVLSFWHKQELSKFFVSELVVFEMELSGVAGTTEILGTEGIEKGSICTKLAAGFGIKPKNETSVAIKQINIVV